MASEPTDPKDMSLAERLNDIPMDQRERLEKSWEVAAQAIIPEGKEPPGLKISKLEWKDDEETKVQVEEVNKFLGEFFKDEETVDPMQLEIGLKHGIVDYQIARDEQTGKIACLLSSQNLETQNAEGQKELSMLIWYVATSKDYKGRSVVRNLASAALTDLMKKSQDELKPIKAVMGETEPEVEKVFNRYAGMRRVYEKDKDGNMSEVPYLCPPEDESEEGVPAHFMMRSMDGKDSISRAEYMELVKAIHGQYTREEYFTPEYFAYLEDVKPEEVSKESVDQYRKRYLGITENIQKDLEESLKKGTGDLVFMTAKERKEKETA